jgi:membrane protein YqaA with SNARE-associated domain
MHLTHPGYVSDMDFTALLFAAAGAVLGGAVGLLLGFWLASHSAAK